MLLGAVLAGGLSSRMGRDKAGLILPGGETWLAHAYGLLESFCDGAIVVGGGRVGFPCVEDCPGSPGPARGVAAALKFAATHGYGGILVLPCDLPCMVQAILLNLAQIHFSHPYPASCYQSEASGKLEMLTAIYDVSLLPLIQTGLANGASSLFKLIPAALRFVIPYRENWQAYFKNCNTPEDVRDLGMRW